MKTKNQLVLAMTIAMITMPVLAAGPSGNNDVWTSGNGSTIVDGNGNPLGTIINKKPQALGLKEKLKPNSRERKGKRLDSRPRLGTRIPSSA